MPFLLPDSPTNNRAKSISPTRQLLLPPRPEGKKVSQVETGIAQKAAAVKPASQKYVPPHLRAKSSGGSKKYVPPHVRNRGGRDTPDKSSRFIPPHERNNAGSSSLESLLASTPLHATKAGESSSMVPETPLTERNSSVGSAMSIESSPVPSEPYMYNRPFQLGGCADPSLVDGSILDEQFIPKKASKAGPASTESFGCFGGGSRLECHAI